MLKLGRLITCTAKQDMSVAQIKIFLICDYAYKPMIYSAITAKGSKLADQISGRVPDGDWPIGLILLRVLNPSNQLAHILF